MASTAHVGDSRALIFPVMCNGYLQLDYSENNNSNYKHNIWGHKDEAFTFEAIISPYDVNGIGHRTSGKGRLDSTKTPPSPNLSLDNHADATSNYESVAYFGSGRNTHKMMLFHNPKFQFYLENTTSSNFNQPAEYKLVCKLISGSKTHTIESDAVITSSNSLKGYYDPEGFYENGGLVSDKTELSTSATTAFEQATVTISGSLASFTNTAATSASLGSTTITVGTQPTTGNGSLDTSGSSTPGGYASGTVTMNWDGTLGTFNSFNVSNAITVGTQIANHSVTVYNDGTTQTDAHRFVMVASSNMPSGAATGSLIDDYLNSGSGISQDIRTIIVENNGNQVDVADALAGAISGVGNSLRINASALGNTKTVTLMAQAQGAAYNNTITVGSSLTGSSSGAITASGMSGGATASSTNGTKINEYITISMGNAAGNSLITKRFKFVPATQTLNGSFVTHSTGQTMTTANGTSVVKVVTHTSANTRASRLRQAIRSTNGFGSSNTTSVSSNVVTVISPNTHASSNQTNQNITVTSSQYGADGIVTIGSNPFDNFAAATSATTPTAYITITDSVGNAIKYKPSKGHNGESTGSTGTENGGVTYFLNDASSTTNTATNLRTAIASSNGHGQYSPAINASASSNVVTVPATAATGSHALARTSNMSSQISVSSFSGGSGNAFTVSSGEADGIGAGNQIFNNAGVLIGTVLSVSGNNVTLSASPATPITSTLYVSQPREALYIEQLNKVSCTFDKRNVSIYINNILVQRKKLDIFSFEFDGVDCYIGQDGTNTNTQFMGELYEVSMHRAIQPCATISTLTPNFSDTLFYYTFGE